MRKRGFPLTEAGVLVLILLLLAVVYGAYFVANYNG